MSVRTERVPDTGAAAMTAGHADALATISAAQQSDSTLSESNDYNVANPDNPLTRKVVVCLRASLDDLCLRKAKASWTPSEEALNSIFQQKRFTDLQGTQEIAGDLKSVVLHKIEMEQQSNTFPIAVGVHVVGVENKSFSITGDSFATIALPESSSQTSSTLAEEDVSLAYEFARKFVRHHTLTHTHPLKPALSFSPLFSVPLSVRVRVCHSLDTRPRTCPRRASTRSPRSSSNTISTATVARILTFLLLVSVMQVQARKFCLVAAGAFSLTDTAPNCVCWTAHSL